MGAIVYNKLVRDTIPAIIRADGQTPDTRILSDDEYRKCLLEKLVEEATELLESDGDIGERADVAEVLRALDKALTLSAERIEEVRVEKFQKRGGFEQKIFLKKVETND